MFEAYIDGTSQRRATLSRRLGGHATAVLVHVAIVFAAVVLAPPARPAPAPLPAISVPVHVAHLFWPASPKPPSEPTSEPPGAVAAPAPNAASHVPAPNPRPPRRGRMAAVPLPTLETPAPARPAAEPALETDGLPGVETAQASGPSVPAAGGSTPDPSPTPSRPLPPSALRFLPEPLANQQKLAGAAPEFPATLAVNGALYVIQARICVGPSGDVDRVDLLKTAHPTLDANVRSAVAKWRYRPLLAGPVAVPFCTLARFEFRAT
jgi:hypothetical protein